MDIKTFAIGAAIVVLAILGLWAGFKVIGILLPLLIDVSGILIDILRWVVSLAILICVAIILLAAPLIAAAAVAIVIAAILEKVKESFAKLQGDISAQARDAAIDAAVLGALGLYAGLVFFMGTDDFLHLFQSMDASHKIDAHSQIAKAVRILAIGAAACSVSKMLFLIPVRSAKVIAVLIPFSFFAVVAIILYQISLSEPGLSQLLSEFMKSPPIERFVLATTAGLLVVALAYPFTPSGWRRILRIERNTTRSSNAALG